MLSLLFTLLFTTQPKESPSMQRPLVPSPVLNFVAGPGLADTNALRAWLARHSGDQHQLRLPVTIATATLGARDFKVGSITIDVSDSALGVSLADHVRQKCRAGGPCTLWLEGLWADNVLSVRKVGAPVSEPIPLVGREADVRVGQAFDAKTGAVLQMTDGQVIYLQGLMEWPKEAKGKRVSVSGLLVTKKLIPSPAVDARGAISQGAEGEQSVFESARWTVVP